MENTEIRYPKGRYMEVSGQGLESATRDGWALVQILDRPGAGPSFLVRVEPAKQSSLEQAREVAELAELAAREAERELAKLEATTSERIRQLVELVDDGEAEINRRVDLEFDSTRHQEAMRDRLRALETTLGLFREEVGRARAAEIEGGRVQAASAELDALADEAREQVLAQVLELADSHFAGMGALWWSPNCGRRQSIDVPAWLRTVADDIRDEPARHITHHKGAE